MAARPIAEPSDRDVHVLLIGAEAGGDAQVLPRESVAPPFRTSRAESLDRGVELLESPGASIDLVLLELPLGGSSGLEPLMELRRQVDGVPIVALCAADHEELAAEAVRSGCSTYLLRSELTTSLLIRTLQQVLDRRRLLDALAQARRRELHLTTHDALTGLPNRALFFEMLDRAVALAGRHDRTMGVLVLHVDGISGINDRIGSQAGDDLIRCVGHRLSSFVRSSDTFARLGGEEFGLVLSDIRHAGDGDYVARKLLELLAEPLILAGRKCEISVMIGIATFPDDGSDARSLIDNAVTAIRHAKSNTGDRYAFYRADMSASQRRRLKLEAHLRNMLDDDGFVLHYQPQVDVSDGSVVGFEALLRCRDGSGGLLEPDAFLAIAQETNLIIPIGAWVLRSAVQQAGVWSTAAATPLPVAINVSAQELRGPDFVSTVAAALDAVGLPPGLLELDVPESALAGGVEDTLSRLQALKDLGLRLIVDDFGTGYSSLVELRRLPIDAIKIDRAFIDGIDTEPLSTTLPMAILTTASALGLDSIAEGVETREQMEALAGLGCSLMQGYLFARPAPAGDMGTWLGGTIPDDILALIRYAEIKQRS